MHLRGKGEWEEACAPVCVWERERRGGVQSRGAGGRGRGSAPVCGGERQLERAAGSPRLSWQRGVATHGQKVFSASQGSLLAGGGSGGSPAGRGRRSLCGSASMQSRAGAGGWRGMGELLRRRQNGLWLSPRWRGAPACLLCRPPSAQGCSHSGRTGRALRRRRRAAPSGHLGPFSTVDSTAIRRVLVDSPRRRSAPRGWFAARRGKREERKGPSCRQSGH